MINTERQVVRLRLVFIIIQPFWIKFPILIRMGSILREIHLVYFQHIFDKIPHFSLEWGQYPRHIVLGKARPCYFKHLKKKQLSLLIGMDFILQDMLS
jgi:hypothetical protein